MAARSRHTCSTLMPRRSASVFAERSAISVRTQPGSTALDVTPNGPASWATARASPITPCLDAVYALPERSAISPAVELVNTSRPKPRLHMPPAVNLASSNGASRLMRIVSRQTSGSCSHTSRSWAEPIPWFTTSTSIGPRRRSVSATASAQPSAVPRAAATYSRPTAASSDALRDTAITRAPAADSSSAASRPIPRPPPVTSATRFVIHQLRIPCSQNRDTPGWCDAIGSPCRVHNSWLANKWTLSEPSSGLYWAVPLALGVLRQLPCLSRVPPLPPIYRTHL